VTPDRRGEPRKPKRRRRAPACVHARLMSDRDSAPDACDFVLPGWAENFPRRAVPCKFAVVVRDERALTNGRGRQVSNPLEVGSQTHASAINVSNVRRCSGNDRLHNKGTQTELQAGRAGSRRQQQQATPRVGHRCVAVPEAVVQNLRYRLGQRVRPDLGRVVLDVGPVELPEVEDVVPCALQRVRERRKTKKANKNTHPSKPGEKPTNRAPTNPGIISFHLFGGGRPDSTLLRGWAFAHGNGVLLPARARCVTPRVGERAHGNNSRTVSGRQNRRLSQQTGSAATHSLAHALTTSGLTHSPTSAFTYSRTESLTHSLEIADDEPAR
jgi:hypothetical protein